MEHLLNTPIILAATVACLLYLIARLLRRSKLPLPPGPRGIPLIHNLFDIPAESQWLQYVQWSSQYGSDIIHLQLFDKHLVVLNTASAAAELLDKKSAIYSTRPHLTMLGELAGLSDWSLVFMPYGSTWRAIQAQIHQTIGPSKVAHWRSKQTGAAHAYARSLLDSPEDFLEHTRTAVGANILNVTYGIQVAARDDPWVELAENANSYVSRSVSGYLVDVLPILKYLPTCISTAKVHARRMRTTLESLRDRPFQYVQGNMLNGRDNDCIAGMLLKHVDSDTGDVSGHEITTKNTTSVMYGAGADTSVAVLKWFLLAITLHPEVQARAHRELDQILQQSRLPTLDDDIPYITAIMKESLRWNPTTPLGVAHCVTEDDVAFGYFIPKGTTVIGNIWAILHNETVYPEPFSFKPERFLGPNPNPDPFIAFGFGRRMCPGRFLAMETLWIDMATVLSVFSIGKPRHKDGRTEEPVVRSTSGLISHPVPFKCEITPRSAELAGLVRAVTPSSSESGMFMSVAK